MPPSSASATTKNRRSAVGRATVGGVRGLEAVTPPRVPVPARVEAVARELEAAVVLAERVHAAAAPARDPPRRGGAVGGGRGGRDLVRGGGGRRGHRHDHRRVAVAIALPVVVVSAGGGGGAGEAERGGEGEGGAGEAGHGFLRAVSFQTDGGRPGDIQPVSAPPAQPPAGAGRSCPPG